MTARRGMNYRKLILSNGAPLYVLRMPWVKTVGLGVHVNAGSRDEIWPKQAGLAHAYEHMVFQGTEEFSDSKLLTEHIEAVGGIINAWTWSEMTFFYNCLPAEEKERGFKVLSQQIRKPLFLRDKIDIEMKNIIQEINRANDSPSTLITIRADEFLYGDHPLSKMALGTKESVSSFKQADFIEWRDKFYHPSNFTFVAVGDIEPAEAEDLFRLYFQEKSFSPANKRVGQTVPKVSGELVIEKEIEQAHVILGAITPGTSERVCRALRIFKIMLDGGMSFPLFQEIRDKRGLCYEISADYNFWSDAGTFIIYFGTDPKRIEEAEKAIHEVIGQVKNSSLLLETAKRLVKGRLAFTFESPRQLISSIGHEITFHGKPRGYKEILKVIESITIEEIEEAVNHYLIPERIVKVALLPKSSSG